ncbi:reverse transcriptase (RNA-dependent DNA polymerase) [Marinobacterium halophilum]|uniref:Reverse transcriptase (RNA-dependent DNA polymerase) n=1 Tax=Marinobacterium halophilum TaxID=267374 RepID=A0A2P8EVD2_9GAMM|nr:antiviral reverse transcriptase Drt3b [Marinobacterium halophilum]PSL13433.1 reverse transcriptase (RNA-dependent DNA polymerase) [Marinobacterium halophilum]
MKKAKIKLNDYSRILLSETSPYDVPIIFTNNWFYQKIKNKREKNQAIQDIINYAFDRKDLDEFSMPMRYKIRKDDISYRHMGLIHPAQQLNMLEFYKTYADQILLYCSKSSFSIRRPAKVASSYFKPNKLQESKSLKSSSAERISDESNFRHSTSYFAYDRHTKLYQFFEDEEFFKLEGKYTDFWSIDITKCFDSLYSHSISWATKGKFRAKSTKAKDTFGAIFDRLMQRSNFNETNGIIIGNEVSRIFAETILQDVDYKVKLTLSGIGLQESIDYDVRRYVDDYFIFASSPETCQSVLEAIEDNLRGYKLFVNKQKTKKTQKPFITGITRSKLATSNSLTDLYDLLFLTEENITRVNTIRIRSTYSVVKSFINKIKSPCHDDKETYYVMTGYVISALTNKIRDTYNTAPNELSKEDFSSYRNAFVIILKIAFHLFSVNPSFNNSIKLSMLSYISFNFFERYFPEEEKTIKLLINGYIRDFFESGKCKQSLDSANNYFPIEFSNLLFVARNMGSDYLLNHKQIKSIFDLEGAKKRREKFLEQEENSDYFQLTSLLYYIGNEPEYDRIKNEAIKEINSRLSNLEDLHKDAKLCYLLLDSISCPFIPERNRKTWSSRLYETIYKNKPDTEKANNFFNSISEEQWFISWYYPDLWNTLEKKELQFEY